MHTGSCLCGAVTITITGALEHPPEACHCTMCRKHTGHYFAGINVRRDALSVSGEDKVGWYPSSSKVRRGFCSVCGSTLFWAPTIEGYPYTSIAMGALDGSVGATLAKHTYVDEMGDYYALCDDVPQLEGS
ncbi:MAG: hypothetical protein ACI81R_003738 [Bradymonadia bacterium]|jgi:hypothetical protein